MPTRHLPASEKITRLALPGIVDKSITVLLVEDSRTVRTQLGHYIGMLNNVTLLEAETLAEAQVILDAQSSTLFCAILDLTLPDASGLQVVDLVRAYQVPIIVLTGSVDPFLRQAVLDLRVIDYMFKGGNAALEDVAYLIGRLRQNETMKVMIVDDSATYRLHLTGLLAQYRFPVLAANNGQEALDLLKQNPDIALIITDYFMPVMNGLEMVKAIRRHRSREDIAIIALSDIHQSELSAAMLKAGANDFLNKGFQAEEFYCRMLQNINVIYLIRQLRNMANCDYLTGLFNRRHFYEVAERLHADATETQQPLAVAMIDADHFKHINDQFGHSTGDLVLKRLSAAIHSELGDSGIVARYGGEEFIWAGLTDDENEVAERFERLRASVEAIRLDNAGATIGITVSIGVSNELTDSLSESIERADKAVYQAKSSGRNRVVTDAHSDAKAGERDAGKTETDSDRGRP